jgi:hypothetical protein
MPGIWQEEIMTRKDMTIIDRGYCRYNRSAINPERDTGAGQGNDLEGSLPEENPAFHSTPGIS